MDYVIKIMAPAERNYCYTDSQQLDKQTGCIGHLRGDMDKAGNGFFTSWWDHCPELKTQAFKDEFDDFINALRFDDRYGGIFKNRSSLSRYCYEHKESVFAEDFIPQYGFRVDTPEHAYLLRLNPMQGDYNLYVYCYRREALDRREKRRAWHLLCGPRRERPCSASRMGTASVCSGRMARSMTTSAGI